MLHLQQDWALFMQLPSPAAGLKGWEGFKLKRDTKCGRMEAPKAAQKGHRRCLSHKVRCVAMHIQLGNPMPMLNKDARSHWLGRDDMGYATIKGNWMLVLLDTGANVNMITPVCVMALGLQMGPLMDLCEGGITIDQPFNYEGWPIGYVIMRVQIDRISGYDEDQVTLIAQSSAEFVHKVPIILGTPTTNWVIATLKESEIDELTTLWACIRKSMLLQGQCCHKTCGHDGLRGACASPGPWCSWALWDLSGKGQD